MGTIVGSIDNRNRPLVRVSLVDREESLLALVDTGFNGDLYVTESVARRIGFERTSIKSQVELAGAALAKIVRGRGTIQWLGQERRVQVFIAADPRRPPPEGDPEALLGTGLLAPHILLVDFTAMTVEIEEQ